MRMAQSLIERADSRFLAAGPAFVCRIVDGLRRCANGDEESKGLIRSYSIPPVDQHLVGSESLRATRVLELSPEAHLPL